jgi:hypothetical protein
MTRPKNCHSIKRHFRLRTSDPFSCSYSVWGAVQNERGLIPPCKKATKKKALAESECSTIFQPQAVPPLFGLILHSEEIFQKWQHKHIKPLNSYSSLISSTHQKKEWKSTWGNKLLLVFNSSRNTISQLFRALCSRKYLSNQYYLRLPTDCYHNKNTKKQKSSQRKYMNLHMKKISQVKCIR